MKKPSKLARNGSTWGLAMVAPTIIGLLILNIVPFFQTIYMSFSKTKAFGAYEFCGFANYIEMFQTPEFWKATWNSVYFCILTVPIGVFLSLLVAVLLNAKIKGKTVFRAIYFLPMVVAPAAVAMVWKWIFNTEYGIINTLFGANVRWLTDPNVVMITCAIVAIWSAIGYDAVLLLSGIQNISKSLYEAAGMDGASKVRQFFTITLPMVSPTLFVVLIMRLMASLKVYDLIYMMVEPDSSMGVTSTTKSPGRIRSPTSCGSGPSFAESRAMVSFSSWMPSPVRALTRRPSALTGGWALSHLFQTRQ